MVRPGAMQPSAPSTSSAAAIDRIVVINDFASASGGGASLIALQAIREYRRRGIPVTLLTGQEATAELDALGVETVGLGASRLLELSAAKALLQGFHNATATRILSAWIAANDTPTTAYHLHNWSQILSPAVFGALRPVERRLVVTCHDFFAVCPNGGFVHYGRSEPCELKPLSLQCLTSQCDRRNSLHKAWRTGRQVWLGQQARFARSEATFTFLHDRMRDKFVGSGFPARNLVTLANPVEPWTTGRIPAERNRGFLFVGRLGADKGSDLAVQAARASGQHITLIGDPGPDSVALAADLNVTVEGWCNRAAIARHASQARALVVPSRVTEPFGLVILEAAASGLPVIVSDRAYLAAEVEAGGFGRSFCVSRPETLGQILREFAGDDTRIEAMSRTGHVRAKALCQSPADWGDALLALFAHKLAATRSA
jgi:glycosyltransferase involved in cell wall biosynthesis